MAFDEVYSIPDRSDGEVCGVPLVISNKVSIPDAEIELDAIRAQGAGGQHVNKVSSAVHLRFDVPASSLPDFYKQRLLALRDRRINSSGVIVIKAQARRSREQNRQDALERLRELIRQAVQVQKRRLATRPSRTARRKRIEQKVRRGRVKALRGRVLE